MPLDFEWLRQRRTAAGIFNRRVVLNHASLQTHLHLSFPLSTAASLTFTTVNQAGPPAAAEVAREVHSTRFTRIEERRWHTGESHTREFLHHLDERTRRVEQRTSARELVVVRQAPTRVPDATEERPPSPVWPPGALPGPAWNRTPAAPPAPDVNRIAENVMHILDRRVGAWRERMGRM